MAAGLLFSSVGTQSLAANTEAWQSLPLLAALALALLEPRPGAGRWLACGLALGAASLFKQPLLAGVLLLPWAAGERDLMKAVALTCLGTGLAWALAWAPFALAHGGWDFLNCTLAYNQSYVLHGQSEAWRRALGLALHLAPELGLLSLLALFGALRLHRDGGRWGWLAAWGGLGLVTLAASGRYYPHYAIVALGPLAALAGLGAQGLWQAAPGPRGRWAVGLALAAAVGGWALAQAPLWRADDGAAVTWQLYGVPSFGSAPVEGRRVQQLCPEGKRLFMWGDDAEIFYLSRRAPASRFLFCYPFTGEAPPWPQGDDELRNGLQDPRTGAAVLAQGLDPQQPLQAALLNGLQEGYKADRQVPGWILGIRR
jgi:hypothetical protein